MIKKIISGGQTGVDRAALDAAIQRNIPHGGWCPMGRRAEDGTIDTRYQLLETTSHDYSQRTEYNVTDADGTLILNMGSLEGGTAFTMRVAQSISKPCLILDLHGPVDTTVAHAWLTGNNIQILNVAGPRESRYPGIYARAKTALELILTFIQESKSSS